MPKQETSERTTSTGNCQCYCEGPANSGCYCGWWVFFLVVDFTIGASRVVNGIRRQHWLTHHPPHHPPSHFRCAAGMLLFVAFNQTYGAIMSFVGGTIVTTAVSSFFLGVAELVFAILIIVCCFTWFFCIGRFLGFMFFLSGRGVAYFLLGLLSLTDPRVATWLNIVQFLLCWCLIIFGIVRVRSVSSTPSHLSMRAPRAHICTTGAPTAAPASAARAPDASYPTPPPRPTTPSL
jgi:hypothetical protein